MVFKYFLPFCVLSFCFVYGFLCCAKAYKFDLFIFAFISFVLRDSPQKTLLQFMSENVLPMSYLYFKMSCFRESLFNYLNRAKKYFSQRFPLIHVCSSLKVQFLCFHILYSSTSFVIVVFDLG